MLTTILISLGVGLLAGGGGGWYLTSLGTRAEVEQARSEAAQADARAREALAAASAVEHTADVVEQAAREGVLAAGVSASLASYERARLVCEGPKADEAACLTVLCWQATESRSGQAQGVDCSALANLWLSGQIMDRCEAAEGDARERCYQTVGRRK